MDPRDMGLKHCWEQTSVRDHNRVFREFKTDRGRYLYCLYVGDEPVMVSGDLGELRVADALLMVGYTVQRTVDELLRRRLGGLLTVRGPSLVMA